jgi:MFS family permease
LEDKAIYPGRIQAYYLVLLLMLACFLSFADRYLLTLLAPAVQQDLGLSDTQLSLLQGLSFSIFYGVLGIPLGWVADHKNRRNLIAAGMTIWCLATIFCGFARSFPELLLARSAVGIGEAALMPAAFSMMADSFPPERRGRVFGLYTSATALGTGGALVLGGTVLTLLKQSGGLHLGALYLPVPWKAAFVIVGMPGLVVAALILFTLREPPRQRSPESRRSTDANAAPSLLHFIKQNPKLCFCVLGAYSTYTAVSYSTLSWAPTLMVRKFQFTLPQAGYAIGLCALTTGVLGTIAGGIAADHWSNSQRSGGKFRAPLFWSWIIVPVVLLFTLPNHPAISICFFALFVFLQNSVYAGGAAVMQDIVPPLLVGRATAMWYLVTGVIGQATGPTLTALITDHVFHDRAALPWSMAIMSVPGAIATFFLVRGGLKLVDRARATRIGNGEPAHA